MEFSSSSYIGSESLKGVPVTLLITKGIIGDGEKIVVNITATSHFPISAEGMHIHTVNYRIAIYILFSTIYHSTSTLATY